MNPSEPTAAFDTESTALHEETVELAALSWFELTGWQTTSGTHLSPKGAMGARNSYRQALLEPEFRGAVASLNPQATSSMIDAAVRTVLEATSQDLLQNNHSFHPFLITGIPIEIQENGTTRYISLRILDRKNLEANHWLAANQFVVKGDHTSVRADIVAFVNGMPLAVLELKSPISKVVNLRNAFFQLQNYKDIAPELMRFNQVMVISDGVRARVGSVTASFDRFAPWRVNHPKDSDVAQYSELEVVIRELFAPENFLELITDFVAFEVVDGFAKSKKVASYHQFYAARKALLSVTEAVEDSTENRGGVIWHTQGSGKSLTMLFLVRKLQLANSRLKNPTIVMITDRNDLDEQLFNTFNAYSSALRGVPVRARNTNELRRYLRVDISGLVFTTIQLFRGDDGKHPVLSNRSNVIVIADEAHRSHYGLRKKYSVNGDAIQEKTGFAEFLRQALPHATVIGFTGTPIALSGRNTENVFGPVVDVYDMAQAVADKATVPIHYTSRLIKLHVKMSHEEKEEFDALGDELTDGDIKAGEHLKGKLTRFDEVVGSQTRIELIARDIVDHFELRQSAMGGGKCMIVAISRIVAVRIYDAIADLRPAWASNNVRDDSVGRMKVVITGSGSDDLPMLQPHIRSGKRLSDVAERFKNPGSMFEIAIVRDMWLTGFDVPSLHTIYIDKPMRGHGLMQAIARVNRVWQDKPSGLVVDYIGIGAELKAALAFYTPGDRKQIKPDLNQAVQQTLLWLETTQEFLSEVDWRIFFAASPTEKLSVLKICMDHILRSDNREAFLEAGAHLEVAYAICAGDDRVSAKHNEIEFVSALCVNITKYTIGRGRSKYEVENDIRQLLSRAVMADGVLDIFNSSGLEQPDLSVLSDEFLSDVRRTSQKSLAVEMLRRLLNGEIKTRAQTNIVEATKLSARLDDTIRRYHSRGIDSIQVIEELIELSKSMALARKRGEELQLNDEEVAFYDALAENGSAKELMTQKELKDLAQILVKTIRNSSKVDWTRKESVRATMRIEIRKLLAKYGYPPDLQRVAVDLVVRQAESLAAGGL